MSRPRPRHARTRPTARSARHARPAGGRGRAALACAAALLASAPYGAAPASAAYTPGPYQLLLRFDLGESLAGGTRVVDTSGRHHDGVVQTGFGGKLQPVLAYAGTRSARFPYVCAAGPCPNAEIRVADAAALDPGTAPFEWGVRLRLPPASTTRGSNLLQKGLADDPGGQWKLQVDGLAGRPSCVVQGARAGAVQRTAVTSPVSVATGRWTTVSCMRTSQELIVLVAGKPVARKPMAPVLLSSTAPVTVGAKRVDVQDNDQFYGVLDDVYMRSL